MESRRATWLVELRNPDGTIQQQGLIIEGQRIALDRGFYRRSLSSPSQQLKMKYLAVTQRVGNDIDWIRSLSHLARWQPEGFTATVHENPELLAAVTRYIS